MPIHNLQLIQFNCQQWPLGENSFWTKIRFFYWPKDQKSTLGYMNFQKKVFLWNGPQLKSPPRIQKSWKSHVSNTGPWCYFYTAILTLLRYSPGLNEVIVSDKVVWYNFSNQPLHPQIVRLQSYFPLNSRRKAITDKFLFPAISSKKRPSPTFWSVCINVWLDEGLSPNRGH